MTVSKLKIAIQKSGRLYEDSVKLLKDCGIDLKNGVYKLKMESTQLRKFIFSAMMISRTGGGYGC